MHIFPNFLEEGFQHILKARRPPNRSVPMYQIQVEMMNAAQGFRAFRQPATPALANRQAIRNHVRSRKTPALKMEHHVGIPTLKLPGWLGRILAAQRDVPN
jgi:hypothetical protein